MIPDGLINRAIDIIESNLSAPISPVQVAAQVGYTRPYLDRSFVAVTGESLASYLRRRRLSEAARQLVSTQKPILEIALDFQYQSAEAFTRAFYQHFRLAPSAYRKRRRLARFFTRMRVNRDIHIFRIPRPFAFILPGPLVP